MLLTDSLAPEATRRMGALLPGGGQLIVPEEEIAGKDGKRFIRAIGPRIRRPSGIAQTSGVVQGRAE